MADVTYHDEIQVTDTRTGKLLTIGHPQDEESARILLQLQARQDEKSQKGLLECRMHDPDPHYDYLRGSDGLVHGGYVYTRRDSHARPGELGLCIAHWPRSGFRGTHYVAYESEEHKLRITYQAEAAVAANLPVLQNKKLSRTNRRPDLTITGPAATLASEVQESEIEDYKVLRRTVAHQRAGAQSVWFPGFKHFSAAFKVAHIETNARHDMARGSWIVSSGPRVIEEYLCHPGYTNQSCPYTKNGRSTYCYKTHLQWRPTHGVTVDDIVQKIPLGELLTFDTQSQQGWITTTPEEKKRWLEYLGDAVLLDPPPSTPDVLRDEFPHPTRPIIQPLGEEGEECEEGFASASPACPAPSPTEVALSPEPIRERIEIPPDVRELFKRRKPRCRECQRDDTWIGPSGKCSFCYYGTCAECNTNPRYSFESRLCSSCQDRHPIKRHYLMTLRAVEGTWSWKCSCRKAGGTGRAQNDCHSQFAEHCDKIKMQPDQGGW
jgi:hypothetical protein